jgi:hypothetical protein
MRLVTAPAGTIPNARGQPRSGSPYATLPGATAHLRQLLSLDLVSHHRWRPQVATLNRIATFVGNAGPGQHDFAFAIHIKLTNPSPEATWVPRSVCPTRRASGMSFTSSVQTVTNLRQQPPPRTSRIDSARVTRTHPCLSQRLTRDRVRMQPRLAARSGPERQRPGRSGREEQPKRL